MSEREAFVKAIEADLTDPGPLLVFADWLEERGTPVDFQAAYACRWMTGRGKRPGYRPQMARDKWLWIKQPPRKGVLISIFHRAMLKDFPAAVLPRPLYSANKQNGRAGNYASVAVFSTWHEAMSALASKLAVFTRIVSLEEPADPGRH